jgi:hypothetical protein
MTLADFIADLSALVVTGVRKRFDAPPSQLSTAVLPVTYPRLPELNAEVVTFGGEMGLKGIACEFVVVVSPAAQDSSGNNFALTVTLLDALDTALIAARAGDDNLQYIDRWTVRQSVDEIGTTAYWTIVARVEASDT